MCQSVACGCNQPAPSGGFLSGLLWLLYVLVSGGWWLAKTVVGPALLVAAVLAVRWFSGAPLWGRFTTLLTAWPRWQRAVARTVMTTVCVATLVRPLWTAAIVSALGAFTALAAVESRRRSRGQLAPLRVQATIDRPTAGVEGFLGDPLKTSPAATTLLSRLRKEIHS